MRLEITEEAESTVRAELAEERRRREEAERGREGPAAGGGPHLDPRRRSGGLAAAGGVELVAQTDGEVTAVQERREQLAERPAQGGAGAGPLEGSKAQPKGSGPPKSGAPPRAAGAVGATLAGGRPHTTVYRIRRRVRQGGKRAGKRRHRREPAPPRHRGGDPYASGDTRPWGHVTPDPGWTARIAAPGGPLAPVVPEPASPKEVALRDLRWPPGHAALLHRLQTTPARPPRRRSWRRGAGKPDE